MLKRLLIGLLRYSFIESLLKLLLRRHVCIALYHVVEPKLFDAHLTILTQHFNIISLDTLVTAIETNTWHTLPNHSLVITFDDGAKEFVDLLPIIKKFNISVTHFLVAGVMNQSRRFWFNTITDSQAQTLKTLTDTERLRYLADIGYSDSEQEHEPDGMSFNEIRQFSDTHLTWGSHTITHPILTQCDDEKATHEICHSKVMLKHLVGKPIEFFAYPNGDYAQRERNLVAKCGYRAARSVDYGFNGRGADRYHLRILQTLETYDAPRLHLVRTLTLINAVAMALTGDFRINGRKKPLQS